MGLLEDITAEKRTPGGRCTVSTALVLLDKVESAELATSLTARDQRGQFVYSAAAIARVLKRRDLNVGANAVQRHRRGDCACDA